MKMGKQQLVWGGGRFPPKTWVPPRDTARDLLLVRDKNPGGPIRFQEVKMIHKFRGCGGWVSKFRINGLTQLVLSNANGNHVGYHYVLKWTKGRAKKGMRSSGNIGKKPVKKKPTRGRPTRGRKRRPAKGQKRFLASI